LVLAGDGSPRPLAGPAPLAEVLQAAAQEVEQYTRIDVADTDEVFLAGHAVTDVVHLLAELLENATSMSAPSTRVIVAGRWSRKLGVLIEIEDRGVGMDRYELADANARLSEPPAAEAAAKNSMGLYVVGGLASRHGIDVRLRTSQAGGVLAVVQIPPHVLADIPERAVRPVTGIDASTPPRLPADRTVELPTLTYAAAPGSWPGNGSDSRSDPSTDAAWRIATSAASPAGPSRRTAMGNAVPGSPRGVRPRGPAAAVLIGGALASFQAAVEAGRDEQPPSRGPR
jgi:hypothetical protein